MSHRERRWDLYEHYWHDRPFALQRTWTTTPVGLYAPRTAAELTLSVAMLPSMIEALRRLEHRAIMDGWL